MALLTRTRDDVDEVAEAVDEVRDRVVRVGGELRSRAGEAGAELGQQARRARVEARSSLDEHVKPAWRQVVGGVVHAVRVVLRLVSYLPSIASSVLATVAEVLHRLGDRSAELADVPTRDDRRRSRRRAAVLWFGAGAVTGVAAGVAVGRATADTSRPDNVMPMTREDAGRAG